MGLYRQSCSVAIARGRRPNRLPGQIFRSCLAGFVVLFALTASSQQGIPTQPTISSAGNTPYLDKCKCGDAQRLKDRLEKLKGAALLVANQLQSTPAGRPAARQEWNALQSQINGYLRAMQIQGLTTFPDDSLFLGNSDPFCGPQTVDAGECLNQDFAFHQTGHDVSCRNGKWAWQTSWDEKDMLLEEGNTIEAEMGVISETINRMGGCVSTQACPQFGIVVQNVTTSSINIPGALTERSARSLNNGQGVTIPLTFNQDGSFAGSGSGSDAGSAYGAEPAEAVGGNFGHMQSITASGYIRSGNCGVQPCDVMHLVLIGDANQQTTQMQARGMVNRNLNATTPTKGATLEFDLPAYVGGSAQKTFFSTPILNSYMTVNLVQGNNGTSGLPVGTSMWSALRQCKLGGPASAGGGGATGIVIPGLEGRVPPSATLAPVSVSLRESIHIADRPVMPLSINVAETVHVSDALSQSPGLIVDVEEMVHVSDKANAVPK